MADFTVLCLGAGVQSTTLGLMASAGEVAPMPDAGVFSDTGWEPARVYRHLEWLTGCKLEEIDGRLLPVPGVYQTGALAFPVHIVVHGNIRTDLMAAAATGARVAQPPAFLLHPDGKHGQIRRACTYEYKVKAIERTIREIAGIRKRQRKVAVTVEKWFGISLDEASRMRDSEYSWATNRYPLIEREFTRHTCLQWCRERGFPIPPKSSCIGCPFHSNRHWRELRDHYPEEWADAVNMDKLVRHGLPGVRLPAFLHAQRVPLDEVDLRTAREKGQTTLWGDDDDDEFLNECAGQCGV